MAVTPFHVPFKTEYKPLGLENLMQPLSDLQTKYDATKVALEDATYNIARLSQDDPRGKELVKELQGKTDYIAEELARTGNFRQAALQLKKLNKSFTEDLETKAIVGNYENYKKSYEEQQKRLEKGEITQTDLDTWDYKIKNTFGGTKYDPGTQKYTSINTRPPEKNRETELQDLSLKLAGMLVANEEEDITNLGTTNGFDANLLKRTVKSRELSQAKEEIANFLKTQPRFKDYILDKADREYFYNNHKTETAYANGADINPDEFKNSIYQGSIKKIQNQIDWTKKNTKDPETLKKLNENLKNLQADYQDAITNGTYDNFAKKLYKEDALGTFDRLAYTAADLVDYRSTGVNLDIKTDTEGQNAARKKSTEAIAEIGTISTSVGAGQSSTFPKTSIPAMLGTADPLNNAKQNLQSTFTMAVSPLLKTFDLATLNNDYDKTQGLVIQSADNFLNIQNQYNKSISNNQSKIAAINNRMASAVSPEERKSLMAEKNNLANQIITDKLSLTATEQMTANVITETLLKNKFFESGPMNTTITGLNDKDKERIKSILLQNGYDPVTYTPSANANPYGVIQELNRIAGEQYTNANSRGSGKPTTITTTEPLPNLNSTQIATRINSNKAGVSKAFAERYPDLLNDYTAATFDSNPQVIQAKLDANPRLKTALNTVVQPPAKTVTKSIQSQNRNTQDDFATVMLGQIFKQYQTNLKIDNPEVVNPLEITMNESLNKFTDGKSVELVKEILNNTTGSTAMRRANITDGLTLANTAGDTDYSIGAYNTDRPHYVGKDPNGNSILRFNIKEEFAGKSATVKGAVANFLSTGTGVVKETAAKGSSFVTDSKVAAWKQKNPDNLYVVVEGTNIDFTQNAQNKYSEIVTNGIKLGTQDGQEAARIATANFAPIWLVSDSKRRELYMAAASEINDGLKQNEYKAFIQPPAVWNRIDEKTSEGFSINYTVKDGNVNAKIYKLIKDKDGSIVSSELAADKNLDQVNSNLPTALLTLDLTYGTGRIQDIPKAMAGFESIDFVPGFYLNSNGTVTNNINRIIPVGQTIR
jgi:hypothetical protein